MMKAGQVILFRFPDTDLNEGKLRPALLLGKLPGSYGDWLISMISSQTRQFVPGFDELIDETAGDFSPSGLKMASVIRVGRLAVVDEKILVGAVGQIDPERLLRIKSRLTEWINGAL
jgi:mRNA interferase MazF